jgi:glycerol kinase
MSYSLVIDQGTHASRVIIYDAEGRVKDEQQQPVALQRIDHQRVEQSAPELLQSIHDSLDKLDSQLLEQVDQCGLCTQRSTMVAWRRDSGAVLHPALSWQDRRAEPLLAEWRPDAARIQHITGLPLSAHYGAAKLRWLLNNSSAIQAAAEASQLCLAPLASYLVWHLCRDTPFLVDHSNAHRMQLLDLRQGDWSQELLQLFEINVDWLPACRPLRHDYGIIDRLGVPLRLLCGDQTAACYAHGPLDSGSALINLGSGGFVLAPLPDLHSDPDLLCSIGRSDAQGIQYLLEGTINGAGSALSWLQQREPVAHPFQRLPEWLGDTPSPSLFLNRVGGLGSPWWQSGDEARFVDTTSATSTDHYCAVIDSIAFLVYANLERMQQHLALQRLYVGGGLSQLDGLCQRIADLSKLPVSRLSNTEASAHGTLLLMNDSLLQQSKNASADVFKARPNPALQTAYRQFVELIGRH